MIRDMYRLGRRIGKGGMGEIFEAEHVSIPRKYAVKILRNQDGENTEALSRFHREASIAASVGSRHIVDVFDFGQADDDVYYMVMELLEGESLSAYFDRVGAVSAERWLELLLQIGDGLHAAHCAGCTSPLFDLGLLLAGYAADRHDGASRGTVARWPGGTP